MSNRFVVAITVRRLIWVSVAISAPIWMYWVEPLTDGDYPHRGLDAWPRVALGLFAALIVTIVIDADLRVSARQGLALAAIMPILCGAIGFLLQTHHEDQDRAAPDFRGQAQPQPPADRLSDAYIRGNTGRVYTVYAAMIRDDPTAITGELCSVVDLDMPVGSQVTNTYTQSP